MKKRNQKKNKGNKNLIHLVGIRNRKKIKYLKCISIKSWTKNKMVRYIVGWKKQQKTVLMFVFGSVWPHSPV